MSQSSILVITGPTASGKTERALQLARADPKIEIVNADPQLFYYGFDIGTAKPSRAIREEIPHHMIDFIYVDERYSAARYSEEAREIILEIMERGKTPIVVGGSGLYLDALFEGLSPMEADDEKLELARQKVEEEYTTQGFDTLHTKLQAIDPVLYHQIGRERNPYRLKRAWEFYYATGTPLGEARKEKPEPFSIPPRFEVLSVAREELWKRIETRTHQMLANGWLEEVRMLHKNYVDRKSPAMKSIGYRELYDVIEEMITLSQAEEQINIRTRQYAKRQVTWMKKYQSAPGSESIEVSPI